MKHLLSLCSVICISVSANAQATKLNNAGPPRFDNTANIKTSGVAPDELKVSLSENKLFLIYKNQEIAAAGIQVLDSLIKKNPGKDQLVVEFENINAEADTVKAIDSVLKQCRCSVSKRSVKIQKQ